MFLGRLAVEKGVKDFLLCNLPGDQWVVGDGPDRYELEIMYPKVHFVGYKTGKDLVDILSRASVLVFPSRTETFGLVALEALSCSVPVAAYPTPGPSYIITDGVDGVLSENLEEAAIKCLSLDRTKCREKALVYSWENSAKAFLTNLVSVTPSKE
jgi:glycosyltransferase involved in cell wall biosynthesis